MNDTSSHRATKRPRLRSILPADTLPSSTSLARPGHFPEYPDWQAYAEASTEPVAPSDPPSADASKKERRKTLNAFIFFAQHVRQYLPSVHRDKFRLQNDLTRFAGCIWKQHSAKTVKEWFERREAAEKRCREETGRDLVGNGTEYLVNLTWRELVPEAIEKAAIYAFDCPDPADVAKKEARKERKRKRLEEKLAAARKAKRDYQSYQECASTRDRKARRLASPASSSTSSSSDNTPPPLTPPAYLPSAPLPQYTVEDCFGFLQTPLQYTSDEHLYDAAALHTSEAGISYPSDAGVQHVSENSAYPSVFVYEDAFAPPYVDTPSKPPLLSPLPQFKPQAVPQGDVGCYRPTLDDHAFGSPNFDYEFTFALESLHASSNMDVSLDSAMYGYSVDPAYGSSILPLPCYESQVSPAADDASHPRFQDAVYLPLLDASGAVISAYGPAHPDDRQWHTMETLCGQDSVVDGSPAYGLATYLATVQTATLDKPIYWSPHQF